MFIPCYACTHIIDTEEDGFRESYCEVLCDRGEESLIESSGYGMGCRTTVYRTCGSFKWNKDLDTISSILADLWKRVADIEESDIKLVRVPRRK